MTTADCNLTRRPKSSHVLTLIVDLDSAATPADDDPGPYGKGLSGVSPGPAVPGPFAPCGQAIPENGLRAVSGGGLPILALWIPLAVRACDEPRDERH